MKTYHDFLEGELPYHRRTRRHYSMNVQWNESNGQFPTAILFLILDSAYVTFYFWTEQGIISLSLLKH